MTCRTPLTSGGWHICHKGMPTFTPAICLHGSTLLRYWWLRLHHEFMWYLAFFKPEVGGLHIGYKVQIG